MARGIFARAQKKIIKSHQGPHNYKKQKFSELFTKKGRRRHGMTKEIGRGNFVTQNLRFASS
jgi:hypothetical protein